MLIQRENARPHLKVTSAKPDLNLLLRAIYGLFSNGGACELTRIFDKKNPRFRAARVKIGAWPKQITSATCAFCDD
jgi:hypothetical protein